MGDNLELCSWKFGFMVHLFLNLCPKVDQPVQGLLGNLWPSQRKAHWEVCCGLASARHAGKSAVRWTGPDRPSGPDNGQKNQVQSRHHGGDPGGHPLPWTGTRSRRERW